MFPEIIVQPIATQVQSESRPPQEGDTQTRPVALCKFDEHMMSLVPTYKPLNQQELRDFLTLSGATEDTMDQYLQAYNRRMEYKIQHGGFRVIGVKPQPGDPNVYTVRVPDSPYVLRMWTGGMDYWGQFCLDFFDVERKVPVNLPAGYALYPAATTMPPGIGAGHPFPARLARANVQPLQRSYPLGSWERNMGMTSIPDGEEKWAIPEGMPVMLRRDGHPDFTFQMPTRPPAMVVVQPQRGIPYY
ncbi:hypothetical protein GSI_15662 [Ganoderma sinense ZZ0214-1]|uniref:Uncharacterized protein n=1 Tax=Ganoderma sinense ZZ0214-1 TaxID=1077348 RepID=A0A2G8RN72_9APHY|nr:hypothetical protein GSI_15662 [Ganoderma sinense ZZ0214-1]